MADTDGESLESLLNKATNPSNRQEDWEYIIGFCDQINKELEGPQISVRLLAHKIQSPQEWEAIQALTVLEACMKNCGRRFHNEVGKFRFLNELIKVVSPKYLGDRVSEKVKVKVIEMLFSWTVSLPDEAKIAEAYQMLKRQGIVSVDPEVPQDKTLVPSSPLRPRNPVFENELKSKQLAELLKSKKPEDLQEANRLIKNMVKEDEIRMQRAAKRTHTLEEVYNSVKLLNEMLSHFSTDDSTDGDKELIRELYGDCDKLRQTVFKLATDTEDNDSSLGDILQASDDLSRVMNLYKQIVEGEAMNGETDAAPPSTTQCTKAPSSSSTQSEILIDLAGLDLQSPSPPELAPAARHPEASPLIPVDLLYGSASLPTACCTMDKTLSSKATTSLSLLDKELLSFAPVSSSYEASTTTSFSLSAPTLSPSPLLTATGDSTSMVQTSRAPWPGTASLSVPAASQPSSASLSHSVQDLAMLDLGSPKSMSGLLDFGSLLGMGEALGVTTAPCCSSGIPPSRSSPLPLGAMPLASSAPASARTQADDIPLLRSHSPILPLGQTSPAWAKTEISLSNVHVPLESIKPSKVCPVTAYDKDGVRVLLHFATDCAPGRPDVLVMVVSMLNTAPLHIRNICLQAAVPKSMKVRLQPPSGTELAPFSPILPPAAITQVMLLANPLKEKVRMRYKLTFVLGEQPCTEEGEVDQFPPAERWGAL
ncbi:ADP-ribosylation factor-binding protein GGA3a [Aplochiton taeniatus]